MVHVGGRPRKKGTIDGVNWTNQFGEILLRIEPQDHVHCRLCGRSWNRTFQRQNKLKCPNCGNNDRTKMSSVDSEKVV